MPDQVAFRCPDCGTVLWAPVTVSAEGYAVHDRGGIVAVNVCLATDDHDGDHDLHRFPPHWSVP